MKTDSTRQLCAVQTDKVTYWAPAGANKKGGYNVSSKDIVQVKLDSVNTKIQGALAGQIACIHFIT